ncbi:hypothetical protein [Blastochloris viridis]|uniref:Uncharacterized protein n=1 Tax=Blastochloris viridis TaxID=1079 RepID=A0A0H5B664_BLAVI|nr:hypothetical protein [Blastochloris viridis]ALK08946.1 hypothetical protein BVIR_1157 [Blastochloris viridis]BAR97655.1 hypothetical protein BV133_62 [Blastochloris viridis]CUU41607.1 hypothetical protein BVIRIDIS_06000 [Blastochloris viridis]
MIYLVHRVPGRCRFKVTGLRSDPSKAAMFREALADVPTAQVEARPRADSVIVTFDPKIVRGEAVLAAIAEQGLIAPSPPVPTASPRGLVTALGSAVGHAVVAAVVKGGAERSVTGVIRRLRKR